MTSQVACAAKRRRRAAGVALDAFAPALPDGKLKASLGEIPAASSGRPREAVEAHLAEEDDGDGLGADDDTLSARPLPPRRPSRRRRGARQRCRRRANAECGNSAAGPQRRRQGRFGSHSQRRRLRAGQLLEDDVGDESDWRAGALAAATWRCWPNRGADTALDASACSALWRRPDVRGFAEAVENAKDADAALKQLATLTGRSDGGRSATAAGRLHLELAGGRRRSGSARTTTPPPPEGRRVRRVSEPARHASGDVAPAVARPGGL